MANARLQALPNESGDREDALDEMLRQSMDASDPPSFTPVTGIRAHDVDIPDGGDEDNGHRWNGGHSPWMKAAAGVVAAGGALVVIARMVRRRKHNRGRMATLRDAAGKAVAPIAEARNRAA